MFSRLLYTAMLLSASVVVAQSPWNGTWELNKATVHAVPPTLVIEKSGTHYSVQQGQPYRFDCDVHEFRAPDDGSVRCAALPHGLKVEMKRDGKLSQTWELRLHRDGSTMTCTVTDTHDKAPPSVQHEEYRRSAPGRRTLAGTWTGVGTVIEGRDAFEFRIHDGVLSFRDVRDGDVLEAKLDGTPWKLSGPGVEPGMTWSNVLESERRIAGHLLDNGKQLSTVIFELSPDGKSIKLSQPGSSDQFEAVYLKRE